MRLPEHLVPVLYERDGSIVFRSSPLLVMEAMMSRSMCAFVSIYLLICGVNAVIAEDCQNCTKNTVTIKMHTDVKYLALPTSDEPVVIWMEVRKGIYPNTSNIAMPLEVGEPITILIYLEDDSNLYDIMVTDCWAYDDLDFEMAENKLHLTEFSKTTPSGKLIDKWEKIILKRSKSNLKRFLYTHLSSFKFPEKDQVYINCDVQLCFKSCEKLTKKIT